MLPEHVEYAEGLLEKLATALSLLLSLGFTLDELAALLP